MAQISEKQLIDQIRMLKRIKPRNEWVFLTKSEILNSKLKTKPDFKFKFSNFFEYWDLGLGISKRLAYSMAAFVFIIAGLIGFARNTVPGDLLFPVKKITEQSQAALSGQTSLRQNMVSLNNRINDLAQVSKQGRTGSVGAAEDEIKTNASQITKNLKEGAVDSATVNEIASSLKTLAVLSAKNVVDSPDIKDLYRAVVESQLEDLKEATLTDNQQKVLEEAKQLYADGKYVDALEVILSIGGQK